MISMMISLPFTTSRERSAAVLFKFVKVERTHRKDVEVFRIARRKLCTCSVQDIARSRIFTCIIRRA